MKDNYCVLIVLVVELIKIDELCANCPGSGRLMNCFHTVLIVKVFTVEWNSTLLSPLQLYIYHSTYFNLNPL